MKSYFFYIFISAAMVGTFPFESISGGCAICCKKKENTCCPSETKSHNCEKIMAHAPKYFQPKNISKFGHKNDLKKICYFTILALLF